jgi:hypothetical protein
MSRGITLTVLAGLLLTACLTSRGCGHRPTTPDHTWYDAGGNPIAQKWKKDADGKDVPDPHPYDQYGRQWVYDADGNLVPLPPPAGSSGSSGSGTWIWWWGGSGYRSYSSGPSYRPGPGSSSSSSSPSRSPSSSSISRGGFGSTGASVSG